MPKPKNILTAPIRNGNAKPATPALPALEPVRPAPYEMPANVFVTDSPLAEGEKRTTRKGHVIVEIKNNDLRRTLVRSIDKMRTEYGVVIGSARDADLCSIDEDGIAGKHCRIYLSGNRLCIEDLGSESGTFVEEEKISVPVIIDSKSNIKIGNWRIAVGFIINKDAEAAQPPTPPVEVPEATTTPDRPSAIAHEPVEPETERMVGTRLRLEITSPDGTKSSVRFDKDDITIGRMASDDVRLDDKSASRTHCVIKRTTEGYRLFDNKSAHGTRLGGVSIANALLGTGDEFVIGDTIIRAVIEDNFTRRADEMADGHAPAATLIESETATRLQSLIDRLNLFTGGNLTAAVTQIEELPLTTREEILEAVRLLDNAKQDASGTRRSKEDINIINDSIVRLATGREDFEIPLRVIEMLLGEEPPSATSAARISHAYDGKARDRLFGLYNEIMSEKIGELETLFDATLPVVKIGSRKGRVSGSMLIDLKNLHHIALVAKAEKLPAYRELKDDLSEMTASEITAVSRMAAACDTLIEHNERFVQNDQTRKEIKNLADAVASIHSDNPVYKSYESSALKLLENIRNDPKMTSVSAYATKALFKIGAAKAKYYTASSAASRKPAEKDDYLDLERAAVDATKSYDETMRLVRQVFETRGVGSGNAIIEYWLQIDKQRPQNLITDVANAYYKRAAVENEPRIRKIMGTKGFWTVDSMLFGDALLSDNHGNAYLQKLLLYFGGSGIFSDPRHEYLTTVAALKAVKMPIKSHWILRTAIINTKPTLNAADANMLFKCYKKLSTERERIRKIIERFEISNDTATSQNGIRLKLEINKFDEASKRSTVRKAVNSTTALGYILEEGVTTKSGKVAAIGNAIGIGTALAVNAVNESTFYDLTGGTVTEAIAANALLGTVSIMVLGMIKTGVRKGER